MKFSDWLSAFLAAQKCLSDWLLSLSLSFACLNLVQITFTIPINLGWRITFIANCARLAVTRNVYLKLAQIFSCQCSKGKGLFISFRHITQQRDLCGQDFNQFGQWCGSVGRTIASNSRGPWFESRHKEKFKLKIYGQLY